MMMILPWGRISPGCPNAKSIKPILMCFFCFVSKPRKKNDFHAMDFMLCMPWSKGRIDWTLILILNHHSFSRFKSLADIQNYIKQNEANPSEILDFLKELKESCKSLTGEQSDEVIEDAAILCLRMFVDQDIVMLKHLSQLRQLFGMVQSTTVNNIFDVSILSICFGT